jgi:hypothetical protein
MFTIDILPSDGKGPRGKVADAEIVFSVDALGLAGLKLIGFSVWTRGAEETGRARDYNVTMPSRTYSVNGERRSFALLRAVSDVDALAELKTLIVAAYIDDRWARLHGVPPAPMSADRASRAQVFHASQTHNPEILAGPAPSAPEPARVASPEPEPILAVIATKYEPVPIDVVRAALRNGYAAPSPAPAPDAASGYAYRPGPSAPLAPSVARALADVDAGKGRGPKIPGW